MRKLSKLIPLLIIIMDIIIIAGGWNTEYTAQDDLFLMDCLLNKIIFIKRVKGRYFGKKIYSKTIFINQKSKRKS